MAKRSDYFSDEVVAVIVTALNDAYEANRLNFDPLIGNSPLSFGVAVWQSTLYFLELGFGAIVGADVHRSGSIFRVDLPTCTITFYKFGSSSADAANNFRLDPKKSRTRERIVSKNQLSLFHYAAHPAAEPLPTRDLVVIHSGNAYEGLLEVHVGAPISEKRSEEGWHWIEQLYEKAASEDAPAVPYHELPEHDVEIEPLVASESYEEVEEYDTPMVPRSDAEVDDRDEASDNNASS